VRGGPQHSNTTFTDAAGKIRRTVGWEYVHIAIDDYSRLAYAEVLQDEKGATVAGFPRRAVAFYKRHGIQIEALLTDNGGAVTGSNRRPPASRDQTPPAPGISRGMRTRRSCARRDMSRRAVASYDARPTWDAVGFERAVWLDRASRARS